MGSQLLSWIVFAPLIGVAIVLALPARARAAMRICSLLAAGAPLALASWIACTRFEVGSGAYQLVERAAWIRSIHAEYFVGLDGLSLALVWLSALLVFLALLTSHSVAGAGKAWYALLLLLEVGLLGAFVSLDCLLFFSFSELTLIPLCLAIGLWGGAQRTRAAVQFALFSLAGSMAILLAIVALRLDGGSFSIPALTELARAGKLVGTHLPGGGALFGVSFVHWCIACLLFGFAGKLSLVPLQSGACAAQGAAPRVWAALLAAAWLKLGAFGLLRLGFPLLPSTFHVSSLGLGGLAALGCLYAGFRALREQDFRRRLAFVSSSQMGVVLLGIVAASERGVSGAALLLFSHGLAIAALYLVAGAFESAGPLREPDSARGPGPRAAVFMSLAILAAAGVPGFAGFAAVLGEAWAATGTALQIFKALAALGTLLVALALLQSLRGALSGTRATEGAGRFDLDARELLALLALLVASVVLGLLVFLWREPCAAALARLTDNLRGAP